VAGGSAKRRDIASALVRIHGQLLAVFARSLPSWDLVNDAVNETILCLWERRDRLDLHRNLYSYAWITCMRIVRRMRRRRWVRPEEVEIPKSNPFEDSVAASEELDDVVEQLSDPDRTLFRCIFIEGFSDAAIRRRLGLRAEAYRSRKHRLFGRLKRLYGLS
jgi:RNA polymerase sigma factor (sigma-70 family)